MYIKSLHNENITWPSKIGDFFPYASDKHSYWTGYYTSRPTLKYFERISNNLLQVSTFHFCLIAIYKISETYIFLQICKQLLVFADLGMQFFSSLTELREAVGVLQHHDAITGTSQQHVTDHYIKLLSDGIEACRIPIDQSLKKLIIDDTSYQSLQYKSCLRLNISECDVSEKSNDFIVTVYNPLNLVVDHYVRIPITKRDYSVRTAGGKYLKNVKKK